MEIVVKPSTTGGSVYAPASKSSMQRAVAASLLAHGESTLHNPSFSSDSIAAVKMAECLGAKASIFDNRIVINGGLNPVCPVLDCNESGLGVRLFSALAALTGQKITLTGRGSIMKRPMGDGLQCLESAGARVTSNNGLLPVSIQGPLKGGTIYLDGSATSQFLTGLLMALPTINDNSHLIVNSLASRSYIDLTLEILSKFGIYIRNESYSSFIIPGNQQYTPADYYVEGDWSGAAFLLVMGATGGTVTVGNLQPGSTQPDRNILSILESAGAKVSRGESTVSVSKGNLCGFTADISEAPDLAPPLVALAAFCKGKSILNGTSRLSIKESDRGKTLESEFRKLGVDINNHGDYIEVNGDAPLSGGRVSSHGDHRIAMALAIAASKAGGEVIIAEAESVNKSYPGFFEDFGKIGGIYKVK